MTSETKEKEKGRGFRLIMNFKKIKDLNDENNVEMFTTAVRAGKAFAAEQKNQRTEN